TDVHHPEDSPSPAPEVQGDLPSSSGITGTALTNFNAETELTPPKKKTNSGGSPNCDVPAHILEQEARVNHALGSKIALRGVFGQGPSQILCGNGLPTLNEPVKMDVRVPKKKPTGTLPSRPSGRENVAPLFTKWIIPHCSGPEESGLLRWLQGQGGKL
ncbi:hypothetical protein B0H14DRAFT_2701128, partial [Mycena olivaceomarginata]